MAAYYFEVMHKYFGQLYETFYTLKMNFHINFGGQLGISATKIIKMDFNCFIEFFIPTNI